MIFYHTGKMPLLFNYKYNCNYLSLVFALFSVCAFSQTTERKQLLIKEVYRCHEKYIASPTLLNDSLVIAYRKNNYLTDYNDLQRTLLKSMALNSDEVHEIFGNDNDTLFKYKTNTPLEWSENDFDGLKVKLFNPEKRVLNNYHIFSFSEPVFRNDNKYAMILISGRNEGGVLSIYKKSKEDWVLYKSIQLYYI